MKRPERYIRDRRGRIVRVGMGQKGTTYGEPDAHRTRWVAVDIAEPGGSGYGIALDHIMARRLAEELVVYADALEAGTDA